LLSRVIFKRFTYEICKLSSVFNSCPADVDFPVEVNFAGPTVGRFRISRPA
jgi:hypothetical protein